MVAMRHLSASAAAFLLVGGVVPLATPVGAVGTTASAAVMPYDFDADGYVDMAVGVPNEDLRGKSNVGAAQILYGSANGVTNRDQIWHQASKGIQGAAERGDKFGAALASDDFDGDGYADLAIGIPYENIRKIRDVGSVQVLYGGKKGLTARDQLWHQGRKGVPGLSQRDDYFGDTLAAGDFDADGYADLAIGAPNDQNGAVVLLRGSNSGLTANGAVELRQGKDGLPSQPAGYENFARNLKTGDVNGDGRDDLLIGVAGEVDTTTAAYDRGSAVHVLLGSPTGVNPATSQYILPAALGLPEYWQIGDMTVSDFNKDGRDDLALSSNVSTATVAVLHGHADGLHPAPLPQAGTPGVDAAWTIPWWDDDTGPNLASGDVTGDGNADLAVEIDAAVRIIVGTNTGLGTAVATWPADFREWTDLAALPFSGGTHAWLVVNTHNDVAVSRGNADATQGPTTVWSQASPGVKGAKEAGDTFGIPIGD